MDLRKAWIPQILLSSMQRETGELIVIKIPISEDVRCEARTIALSRNKTNRLYNRPDAKFTSHYTSIEADFQGAIAEVYIKRTFPALSLGQPFVVNSTNTSSADFFFKDMGIEVKCARFYSMYRSFFVNVDNWLKQKEWVKVLVCCAIDDAPDRAKWFYILGWIEYKSISRCVVRRDIQTPAYSVPITNLHSMSSLECYSEWHGCVDFLNNQKPLIGLREVPTRMVQLVLTNFAPVHSNLLEWILLNLVSKTLKAFFSQQNRTRVDRVILWVDYHLERKLQVVCQAIYLVTGFTTRKHGKYHGMSNDFHLEKHLQSSTTVTIHAWS